MPITPTALLPGRSEPGFVAALELRLDQEVQRDVEYNALEVNVNAKEASAAGSANAAQANRIIAAAAAAAVATQSPVANAAAAAASALDALGYATLAQATNPDSPVRLNPRRITANLAIASAYNAASVGPITIGPGITVTVGDDASWSIH